MKLGPLQAEDTNPYRTPATDPEIVDPAPAPEAGGALGLIRVIVTDSIRYWEFMRLIFNAVLTITAILSVMWMRLEFSSVEMLAGLVGLLIVANLFYCLAYPVDVFVQLSSYRDAWRRARILPFLAGLALCAGFVLAAIYVVTPDVPGMAQ